MIQVPVSFLLDRDETAAAKLVWLALRLNPVARPAELEALTGLSRHTVLSVTSHAPAPNRGGPRVKLPARLLAERSVGARAKLLYGLFQTVPNLRGQTGKFTYASLSAQTQLSPNTLKQAIADLVRAEWLETRQEHRLAPIEFTLSSPERKRSRAEVEQARQRLQRQQFRGEALMQEYLTLLIDSDDFTDNARPGFLINPLTGARLELDRFYPPGVAFEYNGAQHERETERFSQAEVDAQRLRDLIKAGLCLYAGIHLVIIRAEDLSLQGMIRKVGRCLPLRDLAGHEGLIDLLEAESITYRASALAAGQADGD